MTCFLFNWCPCDVDGRMMQSYCPLPSPHVWQCAAILHHPSPLREQSAALWSSFSCIKCAVLDSPAHPSTPPGPSPALHLYQALWSIDGESCSALQIKAITLWPWRRKSRGSRVPASQTAILRQPGRAYGPPFLIPSRPLPSPVLLLLPPHSSLSSASPHRWLIGFLTPHLSAWLKRPPRKRLAIQ